MAWVKDVTSDPPRTVYLPPVELIGQVVKVVHDSEAGTWSIVYTEEGLGMSAQEIEINMNL